MYDNAMQVSIQEDISQIFFTYNASDTFNFDADPDLRSDLIRMDPDFTSEK